MDAGNGECELPSCFDCNTSRHNPSTGASITPFCLLHLHYRRLFSHLPGIFVSLPLSHSLSHSLSLWLNVIRAPSTPVLFLQPPTLWVYLRIPDVLNLPLWSFFGKSEHLGCYYLVSMSDWRARQTFCCMAMGYEFQISLFKFIIWHIVQWFLN